MPQSSGSLPSPIALRSAITARPRVQLEAFGNCASRFDERLQRLERQSMSSASSSCVPLNGDQSTVNGGL